MTKVSFLSNHLILLIPFPVVLEDHRPLMETVHRRVKCVFRHFELMLENAILTNTHTCTSWVVSVHGWLALYLQGRLWVSANADFCPFAEVSGHKWAAWNHPDPKGHQYRAVLFALEEFRSRNIPCALLWVDYTSIPQSNVFLQQAAINSLSVYATYSSVFLTLVTDDSNDQEALHSYNQRGWCRLELLSFMACGWSERESYICDGSLGPVTPVIPNLHESNFHSCRCLAVQNPPPAFRVKNRHAGIRWPAARPCRRRCTWMCSEEVSAVALEARSVFLWEAQGFFHV